MQAVPAQDAICYFYVKRPIQQTRRIWQTVHMIFPLPSVCHFGLTVKCETSQNGQGHQKKQISRSKGKIIRYSEHRVTKTVTNCLRMHLILAGKLDVLNKSSDDTSIISPNHGKLYLHFPSRTTGIDTCERCRSGSRSVLPQGRWAKDCTITAARGREPSACPCRSSSSQGASVMKNVSTYG